MCACCGLRTTLWALQSHHWLLWAQGIRDEFGPESSNWFFRACCVISFRSGYAFMREDCYYSGKLQCLWTIECILLWCSLTTLVCVDKHHPQQSQHGHSVIRSSVNEAFIAAGTVTEPMRNRGYASAESAQLIQCSDKMLFSIDICVLVVDICTLRDSLLITPCQCCSASCQKLLRSPLRCGKFSIKQINPWWVSSLTVSIIFVYWLPPYCIAPIVILTGFFFCGNAIILSLQRETVQ